MRPRFVSTRPIRRSPAGFTLVEAIVAIVIIEIGLLALTASTGIVIRETSIVRARSTALEIARNRVEMLAATPCASTSGESAAPVGFREAWSAQLMPGPAREIRDSVVFTVQRVTRTVVLQTQTPCAP